MTAKRPAKRSYPDVDASPVKSFFVTMLTRDLSLSDAILDLLDNCVDGVLRQKKNVSSKHPYAGHIAEINFDKDTFEISDNCGGIPWRLHDYAFKMGRPKEQNQDAKGSVGAYGIGMKRAIFKMGRECLISTWSGTDSYEVEISTDWLEDETNWFLPVASGKKTMKSEGTSIVVGKLHDGIAAQLGPDKEAFTAELEKRVATHYAFIIAKGFEVKINGKSVKGRPTRLLFSDVKRGKQGIRPYLYETVYDDVHVFLAVGFTRPISSQVELEE